MKDKIRGKFGVALGKMYYGSGIALMTYLLIYCYNKPFNWGEIILAFFFMIAMMIGSYIEEISREGEKA